MALLHYIRANINANLAGNHSEKYHHSAAHFQLDLFSFSLLYLSSHFYIVLYPLWRSFCNLYEHSTVHTRCIDTLIVFIEEKLCSGPMKRRGQSRRRQLIYFWTWIKSSLVHCQSQWKLPLMGCHRGCLANDSLWASVAVCFRIQIWLRQRAE